VEKSRENSKWATHSKCIFHVFWDFGWGNRKGRRRLSGTVMRKDRIPGYALKGWSPIGMSRVGRNWGTLNLPVLSRVGQESP
jgi:hypothetical protein